jgi:hypothetical protein
MAKAKRAKSDTAANVGDEAHLWHMADALRGSMDAAGYKHVVLGLIFLKYSSDASEEQHAKLVAEQAAGADPEYPDEDQALSILWVPAEARWAHVKAQARQSTFEQLTRHRTRKKPPSERAAHCIRNSVISRRRITNSRLSQPMGRGGRRADRSRCEAPVTNPLGWTERSMTKQGS